MGSRSSSRGGAFTMMPATWLAAPGCASGLLMTASAIDGLLSCMPVAFKGIFVSLLDEFVGAEGHHVGVRHFGIGIANPRQIRGPRFGVQKVEHVVITVLRLELRHLAVRVGNVAEDNRLGGASLLAGGLECSVRNQHIAGGAGLDLLGDFGALDA